MTKSHVGILHHICLVCAHKSTEDEILLDLRLRSSLEQDNYQYTEEFCPKCEKLRDDNYIALVGVRNPVDQGETLQPGEADRTGEILHIKSEVFAHIFDCPVPPQGLAFVEQEVIDMLKSRIPKYGKRP